MNRRLNLDILQNNTFLLPRDILAVADHLIGLKFGMGALDDMNHLKNKRICAVADLLQDQFELALVRLENVVWGTIYGAIQNKLIPTPQNLDIQEEQVVPARYRQEFLTIAWEQVHLQIALSRSEKCIVGTGLERQAALDSGALATAGREERVIYTNTETILLAGNGDILSIPLVIYQHSNKNTCMHKKPQVPRGKCIKKGQILADGGATVGGELSLGKNVLVAYMPWEGYNSEDAVLISERLVYEDIYTSFTYGNMKFRLM
ncbi:hypothetical protein FXO37_30605 [Capsicum annuum]|nr:hypothetical protein FXO37_30605 [Capsicum annuum]